MTAIAGQQKIRVLCVDDHPLIRQGIGAAIVRQTDMTLVAEAADTKEAIDLFRAHEPDVTLLDLHLRDCSGLDALIDIRREFPDARVIIVTTSEGDAEIRRSFAAGARAYVLKSMPPNELQEIVRQVHAGRMRVPLQISARLAQHQGAEDLTARELEVLYHVAEGGSNHDIGARLSITEETVKAHIKHIMDKLGGPHACGDNRGNARRDPSLIRNE